MKDAGLIALIERISNASTKEQMREVLRGLGRDYEQFRPTLTRLCTKIAEGMK